MKPPIPYKAKGWETRPISPLCEILVYDLAGKPSMQCAKPTDYCYPKMGGGWMSLCMEHGIKHALNGGAYKIEEAIQSGETFA